MKIRIRDFQSLGNVDIEAEGLTVVVGRSNLGKSALVRAIEGALFNKPGEEFVRAGRTRTDVLLSGLPTADGRTIETLWEKGHNLNQFTVNGAQFAKVGVSAPLALSEAGYRDVWIGDKERNKGQWLRPQVQHQHDPLFLLTQSGSFISDVMSVVSRLAALQVASGKCSADLKKQKQLLGVRRTDLEAARKKLAALQPIVELHARVQGLEGQLKQAQAALEVVEEARGLVAQRKALVGAASRSLPPATDVPTDIGERYTQARSLVAVRAAVSKLTTVSLPVSVAEGAAGVEGLERGAKSVRDLVTVRPALVALAGRELPNSVLPQFEGLQTAFARVAVRPAAVQRAALVALAGRVLPKPKSYDKALGKLDEVVGRAKDIATLHVQRERALSDHFQTITGVRATKQEHEQAQLALEAVLSELKVCPVCDRPMGVS